MRHGYKGAFEMAATVDYLFAFAATARAVGDHHFDARLRRLSRATSACAASSATHNPAALAEIEGAASREAIERGLWRPPAQQRRARGTP